MPLEQGRKSPFFPSEGETFEQLAIGMLFRNSADQTTDRPDQGLRRLRGHVWRCPPCLRPIQLRVRMCQNEYNYFSRPLSLDWFLGLGPSGELLQSDRQEEGLSLGRFS